MSLNLYSKFKFIYHLFTCIVTNGNKPHTQCMEQWRMLSYILTSTYFLRSAVTDLFETIMFKHPKSVTGIYELKNKIFQFCGNIFKFTIKLPANKSINRTTINLFWGNFFNISITNYHFQYTSSLIKRLQASSFNKLSIKSKLSQKSVASLWKKVF